MSEIFLIGFFFIELAFELAERCDLVSSSTSGPDTRFMLGLAIPIAVAAGYTGSLVRAGAPTLWAAPACVAVIAITFEGGA